MHPATTKAGTILVVEDEPEVRRYLEYALCCHGYTVCHADDGEEALGFLARADHDVALMLLDIMMPRKDGLQTLKELRQTHRDLPVIMLSGVSSTATVVEAMKSGASDFLAKPVDHTELTAAIEKNLRMPPPPRVGESLPETRSAVNEPCTAADPAECLLASTWVRRMESFLDQIGACEAPVLIQGETGVGKEVIARLLHSRSQRAGRPFLKLNCAALPSELVESELFGYERGAFTGAFKSKPGKFEMADTGTILLDEIGDMDFKLQAKLLQVLQDHEFERLGGKGTVRIDVRVIAATHCDLERAIFEGRFREDLYHRLNVIGIQVPPLKERVDEILPLADFFLTKFATGGVPLAKITPVMREALLKYPWPGNVRELENLMRKYAVLGQPDQVADELRSRTERTEALRTGAQQPGTRTEPSTPLPSDTFRRKPPTMQKVSEAQRQLEAETILAALNATHWNRRHAASLLNVDYKALLYRMKKLGLENTSAEVSPWGRPRV